MNKLTINEFLQGVAPEIWGFEDFAICPQWPGDAFAIAASILHRSGAYAKLGDGIRLCKDSCRDWEAWCQKLAIEWRGSFSTPAPQAPSEVQEFWDILADEKTYEQSIDSVRDNLELAGALVSICAVADEAFSGVGVVGFAELIQKFPNESYFWFKCYNFLELHKESFPQEERLPGSSLTERIDGSRLRVLPKAQTPSTGLSIRSLTHYISLCPQQHLELSWHWHLTSNMDLEEEFCNILLFPWPFEVSPTQFSNAHCDVEPPICSPPKTGWFKYKPDDSWAVVSELQAFIKKAEKQVGTIHAVVMPETAVPADKLPAIATLCLSKNIILICGITKDADQMNGDRFGSNSAEIIIPNPTATNEDDKSYTFSQRKHHRWKLDRSQICRYSLSSVLNPDFQWWEHIPIAERSLRVFAMRDWLVTCPLICEDLARLDPVGQVVRAIAPDLVIALLFDGPQIGSRWPAHYATVLADDPGSSVLTITSLGMSKLSKPIGYSSSQDRSNVIAMWRDCLSGYVPIELPPGASAAVLLLNRQEAKAATADGRTKNVNSGVPVISGIQYLH